MYKRGWSDEDLARAVSNSYSMRQVLIVLGLVPAGGNYQHVKRTIQENKLDCTHFLGKGWAVGMKFRFRPKKLLSSVLVNIPHINPRPLGRRKKYSRVILSPWYSNTGMGVTPSIG